MKKVLVTGSNGQLGQSIQQKLSEKPLDNFTFIFTDAQELDITNKTLVDTYMFSNTFDYVINCAAYTAVDEAESDAEKAFQINADAVQYLAEASEEQKAVFIHISTDYVFPGNENSPRKESDITSPIGVYGRSKLEGERLALQYNPKTFIIRTAWLYSPYGNNFVKTMLRLFAEKQELKVIDDQIGSPTNALDLADVILTLIKTNTQNFGVYHYSNEGICSWFGFAEEIKKLSHSNIKILPIPTKEYPTAAQRPEYSLLDKSKIKNNLKISIPDWKDSLAENFSQRYLKN